MKLLLDKNLPHQLRQFIPGHQIFTVAFMGWKGIVNGTLLAMAAAEGFDALVTMDSNMSYQLNMTDLPCSPVALTAPTNSMKSIAPLIPQLLRQISVLKPRTVIHVQ